MNRFFSLSKHVDGFILGLFLLSLGACTPPPSKSLNPQNLLEDQGVSQSADPSIQDFQDQNTLQDPQNPQPVDSCQPLCDSQECGSDGCGGECGQCLASQLCQEGRCIERVPPSECIDTCSSTQSECGTVCGQDCGQCPQNSMCQQGQCVCIPMCTGKQCGQEDGCGGTCTPCPRAYSCEECIVRLNVIESTRISDQASNVKVALSVHLPDLAPAPEMADFRLKISGPALLGRVGLGSPLQSAQKGLIPDPSTGLPYRQISESTYGFTLLSTQNTRVISNGQWLIFDLQIGNTQSQPVTLSLQKREQTFAPPQSDALLWGDPFNAQLVIWPALHNGE